MFSMGEMGLTVLIALIVLGPDKLPKVARTVGRYWQKLQLFLDTAKTEFNETIMKEEPKQLEKPASSPKDPVEITKSNQQAET